jgi:hypothetical protein
MTPRRPLTRRLALLCALAVLATGAIYAAFQTLTPPPTPLAAFVPQGSLLAIESPDFAAVLKSWNDSSEQRAWLTSDNYAEFSRSRLFARLNEAQDQFATTAGLPPDAHFLQQIAGRQSLFAWYDIGNLQFLYITRMAPGAAAQTPLLQLRDKFQLRKAGPDSFYLRSQGEPERTVAFAIHGDYLLLATREDLLANALQLMQQPGESSLRHEGWYTAALAAAHPEKSAPELRMTLNLTRILPTPYFRSYWIQQNITELKQYTAAISDLYRTPQSIREERALIPATTSAPAITADLAPLLQYLPAASGVYRATAHPTTDQALDALNNKLLARSASAQDNPHLAPVADLSISNPGNASDLDTRIDTLPIPQQPIAAALAPLRALFEANPLDAMLVYSTANGTSPSATPDSASLFLPIHTAVVLASPTPWNPTTLQSALTEALRPHLTIGTAGLAWNSRKQGSTSYFQLDGLQTLAFAIQGNRCILASDPETLLQLLSRSEPSSSALVATTAAGFHHTAEAPRLLRIASLLDHTVSTPRAEGTPPAFVSGNIGSLSNTFQSLDSETFIETVSPASSADSPATVHQEVLYQWRH